MRLLAFNYEDTSAAHRAVYNVSKRVYMNLRELSFLAITDRPMFRD